MSTVQMNVQEARTFASDLESCNSELQSILGNVNESIETIGRDAQGGVVGGLLNAWQSMVDSTSRLVDSFTGLFHAVGEVITAADGLAQTIGDLLGPLGKLF